MYRAFWRGMPEEESWTGMLGHPLPGDNVLPGFR